MSKAMPSAVRLEACLSRASVRSVRHATTAAATSAPLAAPIPVEVRPVSPPERRLFDAQQLISARVGDVAWAESLRDAAVDLQPRRKRIAVYGDGPSGARDVVAALLRDPLTDTRESVEAVRDRYKGEQTSILRLSPATELQRGPDELFLPSPWLANTTADIFELSPSSEAVSSLIRADLPIVVVDPYRLALPSLPGSVLDRALIIVNGPLPPSVTSQDICARLGRENIIFTHASSAIAALDTMALSSPSNVHAVSTFQSLYNESGIGAARTRIASAVQAVDPSLTSASTLQTALSEAIAAITVKTQEADHILRTARLLRKEADEGVMRAEHSSTVSRHLEGGLVDGSIDASAEQTRRAIELLFEGRLSWLGLVFRLRVDDVESELGAEVAGAFSDVQQQLVFEAGQISQLQAQLGASSLSLIRRQPAPFQSASLVNHLSSLALSTPTIDPSTLTSPIAERRTMLITRSLPVVHRKAQRTLYTGYLMSLAGTVGAWVGYVPPVEMISAPTAVGLGLLSVLGSLAWGQRRWGRVQQAFWRDWERSVAALRGDIESTHTSALRRLVTARPHAAADGLEALARKRLESLEATRKALDALAK